MACMVPHSTLQDKVHQVLGVPARQVPPAAVPMASTGVGEALPVVAAASLEAETAEVSFR